MPVREQLLDVIRLLVDHPEQVEIDELEEDGEIVFRMTVAEDDLGKVIGRQGRTARALRTVLAARAAKSDRGYALEIEED